MCSFVNPRVVYPFGACSMSTPQSRKNVPVSLTSHSVPHDQDHVGLASCFDSLSCNVDRPTTCASVVLFSIGVSFVTASGASAFYNTMRTSATQNAALIRVAHAIPIKSLTDTWGAPGGKSCAFFTSSVSDASS